MQAKRKGEEKGERKFKYDAMRGRTVEKRIVRLLRPGDSWILKVYIYTSKILRN